VLKKWVLDNSMTNVILIHERGLIESKVTGRTDPSLTGEVVVASPHWVVMKSNTGGFMFLPLPEAFKRQSTASAAG